MIITTLFSKKNAAGSLFHAAVSFTFICSIFSILCMVQANADTIPAAAGGQRYASEYLRILEENEPNLISSGSEKGAVSDTDEAEDPSLTQFTDESGRLIHSEISPAALIDICGDQTPELLFITNASQPADSAAADMTGPVLHVYTFNGFSCVEVLSQILETIDNHGSWCLFQTSGQKNLWVYTCAGESRKKCTYTNYSLKGDAFKIDEYLLRNPPENSAVPVCLDSDVQISEETWLQKETELTSRIASIIQWNSVEPENSGLTDKVSTLYQGADGLEEVKAILLELA